MGTLVLVAAALGPVACGGDTEEKNDYVAQINAVTASMQSGLSEVASSGTIESPDQADAVFQEFARTIGAAARDLEDISAPDDVADEQDEIVQDLKTLQEEATGAAADINAGGAGAIRAVAARFLVEANRLGSRIDATISEINSALQG